MWRDRGDRCEMGEREGEREGERGGKGKEERRRKGRGESVVVYHCNGWTMISSRQSGFSISPGGRTWPRHEWRVSGSR